MHQKHPPAKVAVSRPGVAPSAAYAPREATPAAINATITAARKIRVRDIIRPPVRPPRSFQARELALDRIRELEILFRDDAALVMRRDRERDAPIVHRDVIGMMIYLFGDFRDAIDEADRVHKFLEGVLLRDRFASALPPGQRLQLLGDLFGTEIRHDNFLFAVEMLPRLYASRRLWYYIAKTSQLISHSMRGSIMANKIVDEEALKQIGKTGEARSY